jgi:cytochrome c551
MPHPPQELRALYVALLASILTLAVTFGGAALVRRALPPASASTDAAASPAAGAPAVASAATLNQGKTLFAANCASCHGDNGEGAYGPDLRRRARALARVAAVVTKGVSGKMPAYGGKLSPDAIQAVSAYVTQSLEAR